MTQRCGDRQREIHDNCEWKQSRSGRDLASADVDDKSRTVDRSRDDEIIIVMTVNTRHLVIMTTLASR